MSRKPLPGTLNPTNYIFGCDICLDACPLNQQNFAKGENNLPISPKVFALLNSININQLDKETFQAAQTESALDFISFPHLLASIDLAKTAFRENKRPL
jgi:epoxyqueuosine reductase QueG